MTGAILAEGFLRKDITVTHHVDGGDGGRRRDGGDGEYGLGRRSDGGGWCLNIFITPVDGEVGLSMRAGGDWHLNIFKAQVICPEAVQDDDAEEEDENEDDADGYYDRRSGSRRSRRSGRSRKYSSCMSRRSGCSGRSRKSGSCRSRRGRSCG